MKNGTNQSTKKIIAKLSLFLVGLFVIAWIIPSCDVLIRNPRQDRQGTTHERHDRHNHGDRNDRNDHDDHRN
jgi:hypothetical protein